MTDLPEGWDWSTIGEVTRNFDGRRVPLRQADRAQRSGPYDYYGASGVIDHIDDFLFDGDHLLIAEDGANLATRSKPIAFRASGQFWVNNHAHVLQPVEGVELRFLEHQLNHADVQHSISGSAQPKLTQASLNRMPIVLPPSSEQQRIVAAIDENLSRLDAAERSIESARRRLRQLGAKVGAAVLLDAPARSLRELAVDARYGTSVKCSYEAAGPGVIRIPNVVRGRIDVTDLKFATDGAAVSEGTTLADGDVLFVRTNGSRDLIGRAGVVSGEAIGLSFASYLIRYRFSADVDPAFVCAAVSSGEPRRNLESMAATTAGQYNLSVSKLDGLTIPVPPLEEQRRLVAERDEILHSVAGLEADINRAALRSRALRSSILAAAFSGQLVPQDPGEESASVLLDRIRAERDAKPARGRLVVVRG